MLSKCTVNNKKKLVQVAFMKSVYITGVPSLNLDLDSTNLADFSRLS